MSLLAATGPGTTRSARVAISSATPLPPPGPVRRPHSPRTRCPFRFEPPLTWSGCWPAWRTGCAPSLPRPPESVTGRLLISDVLSASAVRAVRLRLLGGATPAKAVTPLPGMPRPANPVRRRRPASAWLGKVEQLLQHLRRRRRPCRATAGSSWAMRCAMNAVRSRRISSSSARPVCEISMRAARPSTGSVTRSTRSRSCRLATSLVTVGGVITSRTARSPSRSGPSCSTVASTESCDGVSPPTARREIRRCRRPTASRIRAASSTWSASLSALSATVSGAWETLIAANGASSRPHPRAFC